MCKSISVHARRKRQTWWFSLSIAAAPPPPQYFEVKKNSFGELGKLVSDLNLGFIMYPT